MSKGAVSGLIWGVVVAGVGAGGLSLAYPDFKPGVGTGNASAPEAVVEAVSEISPAVGEPVVAEPVGATNEAEMAETAQVPEQEAVIDAQPVVEADVAEVSEEAPEDAAEPEAMEEEMATSEAMEPEVIEPEVTELEVTAPEVMEPEAVEPVETVEVAPTQTDDVEPEAEAEETDEETAQTEPEQSITDEIIAALPKPEGTVGNLAPQVTTNRLPSLASEDDEADPSAPSAQAPPPIERFAAEFTAEEGKPLMSIVLIDSGDSALGVEALESFPYPLTFAVDANSPNASERTQMYRDKGFEVLALVDLPRGATASDVEVSMTGYFAAMPEAVGILEGVSTGVQTSREMADQLTQIVLESGHGMLLQASGLNTARKLAEREGIPAETVFRDFDGNGQSASVMRRFLDQAAFRAGQEGGVVMMGRLQAETISALLIWGLADRASRVSLVPVSAVLTQSNDAQ